LAGGAALKGGGFRVSTFRLHWVMDVVSHDDLMGLRTDHVRANMAIIRHTALNLIPAVPDFTKKRRC
jgi:hypothetical protein